MSGTLVVVGGSLVVILVTTTVLTILLRARQRRQSPKDRYRSEVANIRRTVFLRSAPRVWRRRRASNVASSWAAGLTSHGAILSVWAAGQDGGGGGGACDGGGGGDGGC